MKYFSGLLFAALLSYCQVNPAIEYVPTKTGAIGDSVMVVSAHPLATEAGVSILRKGGNAYDAGVAVHFALAVVFPEAGNLGGGGFSVYRKSNGEKGGIDYREKAPKAATRDMYLDENGEVINLASRIGHKAAGVPGSVAGLWELHQKLGTMPWEELLKPAIKLAFEGYAVTQYSADNLNEKQEDFISTNRYSPWTVKEGGWQQGDTIRQPELVATLTQIQKNGKAGFYGGIVADQIVKEMLLGNGLITKEDLESYQPVWRDPLEYDYNGYNVVTVAPPSSGGIALIQLLQGASLYQMEKVGHNTPEAIQIMTELKRRVYADRATYLGDPDFYDVPLDMLLDESYNKERYSDISLKQSTPSSDVKEGDVEIIESMQTTHYSIVDLEGNALSTTTTLNSFYGCKVMVKGAGFFLNNEMDDFSVKPGVPNQFGLIGGDANAIAPEKRMISSMTPTLIEYNDQLFMVLGTPGGSTIITQIFQVIMNVIDHGMTMQDAIDAPRMHHQWLPDKVYIEYGAISPEDSLTLIERGYSIENRNPWGRMDAILVRSDSTLEGGADNTRGSDDFAAGY